MFTVERNLNRESKLAIFTVAAYNQPTANHEVERFQQLDVAWAEGNFDEYSEDLKRTWKDNFGIVRWDHIKVQKVTV